MSNNKQNNVVRLDTAAAVPARVRVENDGVWLKYTGTREDLISEGLATTAMFPTGRKRVREHDDRVDFFKCWKVKKRSGGLFELYLPAPLQTEAPWRPQWWKQQLYGSFTSQCSSLLYYADGGLEKQYYNGVATHRLPDADQDKLFALFTEAVEIVYQARVERANGPHLERVK